MVTLSNKPARVHHSAFSEAVEAHEEDAEDKNLHAL